VEQARFPVLIDPAQPFMDVRALTHEVLPGVRVTCRMEGDAYERRTSATGPTPPTRPTSARSPRRGRTR
jgi:hypothetical protein